MSTVHSLLRKASRGFMKIARKIDPMVVAPSVADRDCPICGYSGPFMPGGVVARADAFCPGCESLERHRLLKLAVDELGLLKDNPRLLHFAPEAAVRRFVEPECGDYVTADLMRDDVDHNLNIEAIDLPDGGCDALICSHVLEHVDDGKALPELLRILRPGGLAILAVPIIEGWDTSYEDPAITGERDRVVHFLQSDHVRLYGRDFRDRIRAAGFELTEYAADGARTVKHGLLPGDRVFLASRPG